MKEKQVRGKPQQEQHMINDRIRAPKLQVITDSGENLGVIDRFKALAIAKESSLDLVLLSDSGAEGVPVAKIMDFGKLLYEKKKKKNEAKKHQKVIQIKEIKFRPKIGDHDLLTKMNQAIQFLEEGKRVKCTIAFRGRENITKDERGEEFFKKIDEMLASRGFSDNLVTEQDAKIGQIWSRIYYIKGL